MRRKGASRRRYRVARDPKLPTRFREEPKLEWVRQGGSLRQLEDAGMVVDVQGAALDWGYMETWAREIGVSDLLAKLRDGVVAAD